MSSHPRSPLRWLAALGLTALTLPTAIPQNVAEVKLSPQQVVWQELEFGVVVHFNPNT